MSANHEYLDGNLVFSRVKTFCQDRLLVKETHSSAVRVAADRSYDLKFEKTAPMVFGALSLRLGGGV